MNRLFYILITIYNLQIARSRSYRSLLNGDTDKHIFLIDNSEDEKILDDNYSAVLPNNVTYLRMNGNCGLSKAYNEGIRVAMLASPEKAWFLIADQDSVFPPSYLSEAEREIAKSPDAKIVAPDVYSERKRISPVYRGGKLMFVNSGLLISSEVFHSITYDEQLFLDFVDFDFADMLYQSKFACHVCRSKNLVVHQSFSGDHKNGYDQDLRRFRIFMKDGSYYYQKWTGKRYSAELVIRCLHLCWMYKNNSFLKIFRSTVCKKSENKA